MNVAMHHNSSLRHNTPELERHTWPAVTMKGKDDEVVKFSFPAYVAVRL